MPSPHPAVTPNAIAIAKKYGKSVSKGIVEMEHCIEVLEYANKVKAHDIERMKIDIARMTRRLGGIFDVRKENQ